MTIATASERARPSDTTLGVLAILTAVVGLSLGSTMVKATASPGPVVAFWRLLVGASIWHVYIAIRGTQTSGRRTVDRTAWKLASLPGIAFGINLSLFFSGVMRTPIAHAEFIGALTPLIVVPVAAVFLKEKVPRVVMICGVVAIVGIALILSPKQKSGASYLGDALVASAILCWGAYLLSAKSARQQLDTASFMAVMTTVACITTVPIAILTAHGPSHLATLPTKAWALIGLMGVTSGVISHGLIAWAQQRIPVGTISMLQLGQPGLGVMWGFVFLGEAVIPVQLVGMAIILAAVGTIAWTTSQTRPDTTILAPDSA